MESITKYLQPVATLRRMVERAYGTDLVPDGEVDWVHELGFGMFNAAYRLRLRDGSDVVLKIAPPPQVEVMTYEVGAMAIELEALRLIRAGTDVPVPEVHFSDSTHELCDADWFLMNFVDGDNLAVIKDSLTAAQQLHYSEALGSANRRLNSIRGPGFGPLTGPLEPSWRNAFTRMVEEVLGDGERRRVDIGWDYDLVRRVVTDHAAALDEVSEPRLVEWDLWEGNVLVRDGSIVGLLDHERAFWGDPLIEHGFNGLVLSDFGDPAAFVRGYGRSPLTETELVRRRLYGVHLALIMVIETVFRSYVDPEPYRWARAQLGDVLGQLEQRAAR